MASNLQRILRTALLAEAPVWVAGPRQATSHWHYTSRVFAAGSSRAAHSRAWRLSLCPHTTPPHTASVTVSGLHTSVAAACAGKQKVRCMSSMQESVDELLQKITEDPGQEEQMNALANFFARFDGEAILLQTGVLGKLQPQASDVLRRLSQIMRSTAAHFTLQQATNALSTMTLLGYYDVPLKAALVSKVLPEVAEAPPATIASLSYSLGLAGYSDHSLLRELERVVTARQSEFEVRDLAKVLWMFGRAHYNNAAVAALVQSLAKRALSPSASAPDLVYGMWACGIHDTYDQELAERAVQVVPGRLRELSGGELAKLAFALVEEDVREGELFEEIKDEAANAMSGMFPRDIAKLLYALGRAQVGDRTFVASVKPHVVGHLDRFTTNELSMIMDAYNSWGVHDETVAAVAQQMRKYPARAQ